MHIPKARVSFKLLSCAIILTGCSSLGGTPTTNEEIRSQKENRGVSGSVFEGQSLRKTVLGEGLDENRLPVNKYLWRASLDTLSFLPLASIDTFSGVIATDWGAASGAANERVRVTTYVRDAELSATALDVSVFRETLSGSGAWVAAPVNPQTSEQVKDKILLRARELRIQDVDGPKV